MKREKVKEATKEIVTGLRCVLEAQTSVRSKRECVPLLKKPVHRFCEIAKKTEKKFKKEEPTYEISRFLGGSAYDRKKMGVVCSRETQFSSCNKASKLSAKRSESDENWERWSKELGSCGKDVKKAIMAKPIEESKDYGKLLTSFETMRDWMHVSGYKLPDYVWVTPKNMRHNVKRVFERLSSEEIRSSEDLKKIEKEIADW